MSKRKSCCTSNRSAGFKILGNNAKFKQRIKSAKKMSDEVDKNAELVDIRGEGNLVTMKATNGKNEIGMVLKYVPADVLLLEGGWDTDKDYVVLGTYQYAELEEKVRTNSDEKPTLTVIIAEVVNEHSYKILVGNDEETQSIIKAVYEIAKADNSISERCNELLKAAVVSCISGGMSATYRENMKNIESELANTTDEDLGEN